ncbi:MAG TPA: response regulator [Isosphaeraceae bacterium]|jgi:CheY-like chemotaxis protein/anti-sigma regulatory factor (Ser/Thr protein kinase)|nr:response regulator [Isosphaeraceae bacterium]
MERALVVEDDKDHAELTARLVRSSGLEPVVAATGAEALRRAAAEAPALIILDLMLPDLDGFDVCRALRADPRTLATPIVMLTGLDADESRRRGFRVGANAYLTKPVQAQALREAIASARAWPDELRRAGVRGEVQVELLSATTFLQEVNDFLATLYPATPLTAEQATQLRQAVMEIGQNAIEWGHRHDLALLVRVHCRIFDDRVEIVVRDQGPGFDPGHLPHAASPDDPLAHLEERERRGLREGGFGLVISRGMVDELRHNAAGNEVTLVKRFPAQGR